MTERVYLICEWSDIESGGLCVYDAPRTSLGDVKALERVLDWIEMDHVEVCFATSDLIKIGDDRKIWKLEDKLQGAISRNIVDLKRYVGWMRDIPVRIYDGCMRFQEKEHAKKYSSWVNMVRSKSKLIVEYKKYLKSIV